MEKYKQFIVIWIMLILIVISVSCSHKKEIKVVEIIAGKDSTFNINQNVSSPSTLLLDISGDIDTDNAFLIVSFEDSGYVPNRNIRQSIKIKKGKTHHGTDLFEPHFVLYYKNGKAKKGKIYVNIKIY